MTKTNNSSGEIIKVLEEFKIPKTNIILEKGDKIKIIESVELTDSPNQKEVSDNWPDGVLYRGEKIFEQYMKIIGNFMNRYKINGQETYLGYSPSKNKFYSGYDAFFENESGYVVIVFDWDSFTRSKSFMDDYGRFYGRRGGYDLLHQKVKDIIDIRLD